MSEPMFNIREQPHLIDSTRTWHEVKKILIDAGEFTSRGFPPNEVRDRGDCYYPPYSPSDICVSLEYLQRLIGVVRNYDEQTDVN